MHKRIKIVKTGGVKKYIPQSRKWLWWASWQMISGTPVLSGWLQEVATPLAFDTAEEARQFIADWRQTRGLNTIVEYEYLKPR